MCFQVGKLNVPHIALLLFVLTNWWMVPYMYPLLSLLAFAFMRDSCCTWASRGSLVAQMPIFCDSRLGVTVKHPFLRWPVDIVEERQLLS